MILALLLAAAEPQTAIDAERAFSADAHKIGQWAAFGKWSTPDAIMFVPQPGNAHEFIKGRAEPATAIYWWPGRSFVSCDGNTAVNTGPAVYGVGKAVGYFSTVWQRQTDGGWKWQLDHGDLLKVPRAEGGDIKPRIAACAGQRKGLIAAPPAYEKVGGGHSADNTLIWRWSVSAAGARTFEVWLWNGQAYDMVLTDEIKAS